MIADDQKRPTFIIYCKEQVGTKRNPPFRIISLTPKPGRSRDGQWRGPVPLPLTPINRAEP